ncbi:MULTISPECIES: hypothetical protein [unclassified Amycolatopsis]|uniref:hypothetical protein n=1 Tax=unclassified Amycolatopsis TaxID=2618356 RepID=UPI0028763DD0|nr:MULTISPECIES: hypothetical protein [unclassified Amycolatopsis]MDS0140158.1 hypothetical protein [Amycolatopsis sp. 505]MDS0148712.1 hypothetical protein [Amycolatopsis sp. CM201R]
MKALLKRATAVATLLVTGAGTATAAGGPAWRDCYKGLPCTEIEVPADRDAPAGGATGNSAVPGYRDQFTDLAARFDVVVSTRAASTSRARRRFPRPCRGR